MSDTTRSKRIWVIPAINAVVAVLVNVLIDATMDVPMLVRWLIAVGVGLAVALAADWVYRRLRYGSGRPE
ncbi:MAG: hypothetical protein ACQEW8_13150 [Actinomycetota bacterium]